MLKPRKVNANSSRLAIPALATAGLVGIYFFTGSPAEGGNKGPGKSEQAKSKRDDDALQGAGMGAGTNSFGGKEESGGGGNEPSSQGGSGNKQVTTAKSRDELPSGGVGGGVGGGGMNARAIEVTAGEGKSSGNGDRSAMSRGLEKAKDAMSGNSNKDNSSASGSNNQSNSGSSFNSTRTTDDTQNSSVDKTVKTRGYSGSSSPSGNETGQSAKLESRASKEHSATGIGASLQGLFGQGGSAAGERGENLKKFHDNKLHSNSPDTTPTKRGTMRSDS